VHVLHGRQVKHEPAVADRVAGDAVPAALDGQRQGMAAREPDGVIGTRAADIAAGRRSIMALKTRRARS
jgi:hypothetical protein